MKLFIIMIAWVLGIIMGLYLKTSIALFFIFNITLIIIFIIIVNIIKNIQKKKQNIENKQNVNKTNIVGIDLKKIKLYVFYFIISLIISEIFITINENNFNKKYEKINEEQEVTIIGTIISNPNIKEYKTQYILKVDMIDNNDFYKNTKLLLNIKNSKENNEKLEYGDKIYFKANITKQATRRNEGGFDYKQYLKTQQIYEIANTKMKQIKIIKKNNINFIYLISNKIYLGISNKAKQILEEDESNLLIAILLGNKNDLNEKIKNNFKISNLSHILAVSGMHVSYIIIAVNFILNKINISKRKSKIIEICLLLFFILLTGGTPSVKRACIMQMYIILGNLLYKKTNSLGSISFSVLIILIENQYLILDIGFQLSYLGTIGIIYIYPKLKEKLNQKIENKYKIKLDNIKKINLKYILNLLINILLISISANILIFPIVLINFNTFSTIFILANMLVSPLIGIIIILGFTTIFISYIISTTQIIFSIPLNFFLKLLINITHIISKIPFAQIILPTPKIYMVILYYIFLIYLLFLKNMIKEKIKVYIKKAIIFFILFFIIIEFIQNILPHKLQIDFIDVGQGDSTLIITPNKNNILIDGGGTLDDENYDIGENVLLPFLLDKGIYEIDYIIISHFDSDHVKGILTILQKMKVKQVIIGTQYENNENLQDFKEIINKNKIKVNVVKAGDKIYIEEKLYFDVLWPDNEKKILENSINNNALVLKLNYITKNTVKNTTKEGENKFTMLFTGDIEEEAEKILISEYKNINELKSIILKIAHHGSKSSSTQEFLNFVKPKIALIGVGKNNKFGHPNDEVIIRLKNLKCKIYRTDQNGEISIIVNNKGKISVKKCIE